MKTKEEIINALIKDNGYTSYLEIGYGDGSCFHQIKCDKKVAIDPEIRDTPGVMCMTSDELFSGETWPVDIVFIDGDHTCGQVRKDINNASKVLSENGVILVHDIAPEEEAQAVVPRQQKVWTGDTYKAWEGFKAKYPDVETAEYPVQYGLGAIFPNGKKFRAHFEVKEMTWDEYVAKRDA